MVEFLLSAKNGVFKGRFIRRMNFAAYRQGIATFHAFSQSRAPVGGFGTLFAQGVP